jgi:hypothetical protein
VRQHPPDQPERRLHHHPLEVGEPLRREVLHRRHVLQTGVVHQHVDPRRQRPGGRRLGQVRGDRPATDGRGDLPGGVTVDVHDQHPGPGGRQAPGAGLPDAAARAGDQRGPSRQIQTHHLRRRHGVNLQSAAGSAPS